MSPENALRLAYLAVFVFLALVWLAMSEDTYGQYKTAEEQR